MILTLTVNPAIDRNILADRLVFEDRAYILSRSDSAGGRGINASRVLHSFGAKTLAIVTSGGANGQKFEKLVAKSGFPVKVVCISHDIRINFAITDRQGLTVKLNELGPPISAEELADMEKAVGSRLKSATWLMLCGSIPPDVSTDFYAKLIRMARDHKVKTLLDTDGDALVHGVEAGPTVVMPNQPEAERLLNRALITRAALHGRGRADQSHGAGIGSAVVGQPGRSGAERSSSIGGASAAHRCAVSDRGWRRAGGGIRFCSIQEKGFCGLRALGGSGGHGVRAAAGHGIREFGAD